MGITPKIVHLSWVDILSDHNFPTVILYLTFKTSTSKSPVLLLCLHLGPSVIVRSPNCARAVDNTHPTTERERNIWLPDHNRASGKGVVRPKSNCGAGKGFGWTSDSTFRFIDQHPLPYRTPSRCSDQDTENEEPLPAHTAIGQRIQTKQDLQTAVHVN
ncbi:glycoside hydrolase family 61 protein [Moniliophthora roreri]|nr:glycoside hydrolase family 61 protein [Moniliophthora roreri]